MLFAPQLVFSSTQHQNFNSVSEYHSNSVSEFKSTPATRIPHCLRIITPIFANSQNWIQLSIIVLTYANNTRLSPHVRVGQNPMFTLYDTVYTGVSLLKLPHIHRMYMWFWPTLPMWHGFGQNLMYTLYDVYMDVSLLNLPYIHRLCMVLANSTHAVSFELLLRTSSWKWLLQPALGVCEHSRNCSDLMLTPRAMFVSPLRTTLLKGPAATSTGLGSMRAFERMQASSFKWAA